MSRKDAKKERKKERKKDTHNQQAYCKQLTNHMLASLRLCVT